MQPLKIRTIVHWFTTGLLALDLLAGGVVSSVHPTQLLSTLQRLDYPAYLASLLGFWKLLGGFALLVPGMPLLKEWAYAGICFDLTSAAVSHAANTEGAPEVSAPLVLAVLAIASYLLRPCNRTVMILEQSDAARL
jgi:uncharacterized membrane protein